MAETMTTRTLKGSDAAIVVMIVVFTLLVVKREIADQSFGCSTLRDGRFQSGFFANWADHNQGILSQK